MAADSDAGAFSGNFMFVGNAANDSKSGKQIRSHLMREYYRKERWKKCMNHRQQQRPGPESKGRKDIKTDQTSPRKEGSKAVSPSKVTKKAKLEIIPSVPGSSIASAISEPSAPSTPSHLGTGSQSESPPLKLPDEIKAAAHRSSIIVPYTVRQNVTPPHLDTMPEPLFCPPLPKTSDDLSSASETAFSFYMPESSDVHRYMRETDQRSLAKARDRRSMRALAEDLYLRRPSLCGNPGSEVFVSPFGYLPIKLNAVDYSVLQYYTRVPELIYNTEPGNRFAVHNSIFLPIAFIYPETLYMCLASANLYMTQRYNITDISLTQFYKQKAYDRIQRNMNNSESRFSDEVVAGLLGSAVLALGASPDQADLSQFMQHYMALTQVIRMRGGHQSLRDNVRLDMGYSAIVLIIGKTWSDCLGRIVPPGFEEYAREDINDFVNTTRDIGDWLRQTAKWAQSLVQSDSVQYATTPKQVEMLKKDGPLYRLLDCPAAMNEAPYKRVMFERSHHTFVVIYLALAMYGYRDQPPEVKDAFLERLAEGLKENDISNAYTAIPLSWMVMQIYSYEPDRTWQALTFAKVLWRFSLGNFNILKHFLLWLICPDEGRRPIMTEAMIQRLETDVLNDLRYSSVALAIQP